MAGLRKQRACIKFCFKLGKTAAATHQMLKQASVTTAWDRKKFTTGANVSKMAEHRLIIRSSIAWKSAGNFINSFKRIQTFFRRLSLVTTVGFMATILKLSSNRRNGRAKKRSTSQEHH
jgi:hypothetical protein